jgi:hypothetical protein
MTVETNIVKNALSVIALLLSLAAVQSPLWRPAVPPRCVTAKAGGTVLVDYGRAIDRASILQKRTATLTAAGPHRLMIHAHAPGRTCLIINYKDGQSRLYEVVVIPG